MRRARISMTPAKFVAALAALTFLASAALYAEFNAGYYSEETTGRIHQTISPVFSSGATYDAGTYPLFPPSLPADTGRDEVKAFCNTCHSPRYITMQPPLPPEAWAAEVNKMIKAFGAPIDAADGKAIVDYLAKNYGS